MRQARVSLARPAVVPETTPLSARRVRFVPSLVGYGSGQSNASVHTPGAPPTLTGSPHAHASADHHSPDLGRRRCHVRRPHRRPDPRRRRHRRLLLLRRRGERRRQEAQHPGVQQRDAQLSGRVRPPSPPAAARPGRRRPRSRRTSRPRSPRRASGATMNSHSWAMASPPANSAGPIDRAGFTDVLVIGIDTRWISVSESPIAIGANPRGARVSVVPRIT